MEDKIGLIFINYNNKIVLLDKTTARIPLLDLYCKSNLRKTIENCNNYTFSKKLDSQTLVYIYEAEMNIDIIKFVFSWVSAKVKNIDFVHNDLSAKQWIDVMTFADFLQIDEFFINNNNLPTLNTIISEFHNIKSEKAFLYYETEFTLLAKNYINKTLYINCTCNHKLIERCNKFISDNSKMYLIAETYYFIIEKLEEMQKFYNVYETATNEGYINCWKDSATVLIGKLLKDVELYRYGDINDKDNFIKELFNSPELLSKLTNKITNDFGYINMIKNFKDKHFIHDDRILNYSLLSDSDKKDMFYYYYYVNRYDPENKGELKHCICDLSMYKKLDNFVKTNINIAKCIFLSMDIKDFIKLVRSNKGSNKLLNLDTFEDLVLFVDELKKNREYANSKKLTPEMKIIRNEQKVSRQEFNREQKRIERNNEFRSFIRSLRLY